MAEATNPLNDLRATKAVLSVLDLSGEFFMTEHVLLDEVNLSHRYLSGRPELIERLDALERKGMVEYEMVSRLTDLRKWRLTSAGRRELEAICA